MLPSRRARAGARLDVRLLGQFGIDACRALVEHLARRDGVAARWISVNVASPLVSTMPEVAAQAAMNSRRLRQPLERCGDWPCISCLALPGPT